MLLASLHYIRMKSVMSSLTAALHRGEETLKCLEDLLLAVDLVPEMGQGWYDGQLLRQPLNDFRVVTWSLVSASDAFFDRTYVFRAEALHEFQKARQDLAHHIVLRVDDDFRGSESNLQEAVQKSRSTESMIEV